MNSKSTLPIFVLSLALSFSLNLLSQCEEGETAIEFVIDTDTWGYEMYWELTPSGSGCGSADFLASGGNSENVGCDGAGSDGSGGTTYGNNAIYVEGPFCFSTGEPLDLIHVDSYGDGGSRFDLVMDGVLSGIFNGTGAGNVWTFTAGESLLVENDVPCDAAAVEVDGPTVMISTAGATVQAGEVSPPAAPNGSCNLPGSWCGSDANVTASGWVSFSPETEAPLMISSCTDSASFDTQIALYKAEDCADWASFELVASGDDQCGGYRSIMYTSCLEVGATYLIQVEGWGGQTGDAYISVSTLEESDISADAQQRNVTCPLDKDFEANGLLLPFVNLGGADFSCSWTGPNGFTSEESWLYGLAPGTYTAAITTTCGAEFSLSRTISAPEPWDTETTIAEASCSEAADGSVEITVSGATPDYTFVWTGPNEFTSEEQNLFSLLPGTYQLSLSDANGCANSVTAFIPEVEASDFSIGSDTIICEDEPLLIYGPLGYDYEWQDGSTNQFFYVAPGDFAPGTYSIILSGSTDTGCSFADALLLTVHECSLGMDELGLADRFLYPNPATDEVYMNLDCGQNGWQAVAFDATGRKIAERLWKGAGSPVFDVSSWPVGRYTIQFRDEDRSLIHSLSVTR